ncbi:hypothetical protein ABWK19_10765, partial [Bacillus velezensis]
TKYSYINFDAPAQKKDKQKQIHHALIYKVEKWMKSFSRETLLVDFKSVMSDNKNVSFSSLADSFLKPGRICFFYAKKPLTEGFFTINEV